MRSLFAASRDLTRIAYRDPAHVSERLTLLFVERLAGPSREWVKDAQGGQSPADQAAIADELCRRSIQISRIDGAVAGTPFLIALVPGYLGHLWQEGVLVLRLAALYGHDPGGSRMAAEFLALREIHPTVEAAEKALVHTRNTPMPAQPTGRRSIHDWINAVWMLGVFGGFLSPPAKRERPHGTALLLALLRGVVAAVIWAATWIFPVTFMLAMSWGCESHTRALATRTLRFYAGDTTKSGQASPGRRGPRRLLRSVVLILSVVIPIAFVAVADHFRNKTGINGLGAAGAIVALSLVVAMYIAARRA